MVSKLSVFSISVFHDIKNWLKKAKGVKEAFGKIYKSKCITI